MRSGGVRRLRQPEARHFALGHQPDDIAPDELDVVVAEHDPAGKPSSLRDQLVQVGKTQAGPTTARDVGERRMRIVERP